MNPVTQCFRSLAGKYSDYRERKALFWLYQGLFDEEVARHGLEENTIKYAFEHLKNNYIKTEVGRTLQETDYEEVQTRVGYLHLYAACHASLVRDTMKVFLSVDTPLQEFRNRINELKSLDVLSIGGGPGNDLIGACSALFGGDYNLDRLNLTLVDITEGWKGIFERTIDKVLQEGHGHVSELFKKTCVTQSFVGEDLTKQRIIPELKAKIQSADIVLVVKMLSVVLEAEKSVVLKNIVTHMKEKSYLICIDCPFPKFHFDALQSHFTMMYIAPKQIYGMSSSEYKYGHQNINKCRAIVGIFKKETHDDSFSDDDYSSAYCATQ